MLVADNDLEALGVERLTRVNFTNNGFYPVIDDDSRLNSTRVDGEDGDRRQLIVEGIKERGLSRPQHNLDRNS